MDAIDLQLQLKQKLDEAKKYGWAQLTLKNLGLTEIPSEIFTYSDLVYLDLSNDLYTDNWRKNRISNIPAGIGNLKKLVTLNVANNNVESISENLTDLKSLRTLNLVNNDLAELSSKIAGMASLKKLELDGNPFEILPPEIAARGIDSIRNFFVEIEQKDYLYEVKLILVGEGRVGKTCLSNALINEKYELKHESSTEGINIITWIIPQEEISKINSKIQRNLQINIWDFGGQEIYHSTHQFFLTKRSIYLLVTESRKEDRHDDLFYWLNIIKLLGDKSPVVMVLNKCDQPNKELPLKEYKESFNNIIDLYKISLTTEYRPAFNDFKKNLLEIASNLPHIGNPLPKAWVDIRIEIEGLKLNGINYISENEYFEICKRYHRDKKSALFLSGYFHDLGVLLHFQDDIELKDIVVLKNEWITTGVYKILDDRKIIEQKGRFSFDDIKRIWSGNEYKDKIRELLSLMKNKKFDLCFELDNGEYMVPRLLPVDEIDYTWSSHSENLRFEFQYKFMPKGILTRLIVKLSKDILDNKYWRYGVLLRYENTTAIIRERYFENKITIELNGGHKREFLFIIRKAIKEIHNDFSNLIVSEMVPCICNECKNSSSMKFYEFDLLRRYEQRQRKNIICDISLEEVKVYDLTANVILGQIASEEVVFCENENAALLNLLGLENMKFMPEKDSASVFIKVRLDQNYKGLRDRDFLLDSEVSRIQKNYHNYFILEYYCFENYLFHPENLDELKVNGFSKDEYIKEIIRQKNIKKNIIISNYKSARKSYQEFRIESEKFFDKANEDQIIENLGSDDIEIFFKSFSMKDQFNKESLSRFNLKEEELANTNWFRNRILGILNIKKD